jgi:hypothetical protein
MDDMDMKMGAGLPGWLTTVSWIWLGLVVASAAAVVFEIRVRGRRQEPKAMEWIWPLSALYLGPLAIPVLRRFGTSDPQDLTTTTVRSGLPGGVASGLAHVVGVPLVVATGLTVAGLDMWAMVAVITVLATAGIFAFEHLVIGPSSASARLRGVKATLAVSVATILAFDVGMLGWMLVLHHSENMPAAGDVRFTFLMQVGLVLGTLTALPFLRALAARRLSLTG